MPIVYIPAQLRDLTNGVPQISIEGTTVGEVVDALELQFPGVKQRICRHDALAPGLQVSIDHTMSTRGLRAKLQPTSEVHFLAAFGGG